MEGFILTLLEFNNTIQNNWDVLTTSQVQTSLENDIYTVSVIRPNIRWDVLIKKGRHVLDAPLFITKDGVTTEHQTMREAMAEQGIDLNKVG